MPAVSAGDVLRDHIAAGGSHAAELKVCAVMTLRFCVDAQLTSVGNLSVVYEPRKAGPRRTGAFIGKPLLSDPPATRNSAFGNPCRTCVVSGLARLPAGWISRTVHQGSFWQE